MTKVQASDAPSRRRLLGQALGAATLSVLATGPQAAAAAQARRRPPQAAGGQLVYIGSQMNEPGQGVFAARLDPVTGALTLVGLAAEAPRPTWLTAHPSLPVLYAGSELGNYGKSQGDVLTFRADPGTGLLRLAGTACSGGGGPTHLALDLPSRTLLVANFGTGQVAALPVLADATLGPPASVQTDQGSGPGPRQKGPHAHAVALDPSGRYVLTPDLGADRVFIYRLDPTTHQLTPGAPAFEALPPGSGPRRLVFHPGGRFAFVLSELTPELRAYRWDRRKGQLHLAQTLSIAADPSKRDIAKGAEMAVSHDGRFVYVSIRGEDALAVYAVNGRTGALREIQRIPANGQTPWSFGVDPTGKWMIVANQASNTVVVFARDPATGRLTPTAQSLSLSKPVSVAYLGGG